MAKGVTETVNLPLSKSSGWYDFTVRIKGAQTFEQRFAGHVENGLESRTDPQMSA
ncbi:DUF756 domain-containing protein [Chitinophaga sedimenti]|uniref:phospholipase domain-containing protein n=1 Tax=Chitinophaga sedimenti TaxID=2033606 RepID=UPI0020064ACC|nr:phospholipase domain-containing protein [Chitinophaga sedimenti]MCK7556018.1 DUF756 domain-containing protein [Chitinophaga sedimenti]